MSGHLLFVSSLPAFEVRTWNKVVKYKSPLKSFSELPELTVLFRNVLAEENLVSQPSNQESSSTKITEVWLVDNKAHCRLVVSSNVLWNSYSVQAGGIDWFWFIDLRCCALVFVLFCPRRALWTACHLMSLITASIITISALHQLCDDIVSVFRASSRGV